MGLADPRLFVLGAGFSKTAGLPLAAELTDEVLARAEWEFGAGSSFFRDVERFREYSAALGGGSGFDFEQFMTFLDLEHYLWLQGGDTFSTTGNQSQLLVRYLIGKIIYERSVVAAADIPDVYLEFASQLSEYDQVISLNYDVLLESAFEQVGKRYRRFPHRFSDHSGFAGTIDSDAEKGEVLFLKLHGSCDWVSRRGYDESLANILPYGGTKDSHVLNQYAVSNVDRYELRPLQEGVTDPDSRLNEVLILGHPDAYYEDRLLMDPPVILAPSYAKFVYSEVLRDFFFGLAQMGGWLREIAIIGFSMPLHDEYLRQVLYEIALHFHHGFDAVDGRMGPRRNIKVIDKKTDTTGKDEVRRNYRFLSEVTDRLEFHFDGFNEAVFKGGEPR